VIAAQRPALDGVKSAESASFVDQYVRRGIESGLETKALGSSSDAIGGYAVPREIDAAIDETLTAISPIRAIANVVKVGSAGYRKLIASGGTPSGWVGFEAARPETGTPSFTEVVPASGELYANPAASQQMLDDAMFDVEKWLAHEIATEFARAELCGFVRGGLIVAKGGADRAHLGRRQAASRGGWRLQGQHDLPLLRRRRGPGRRSADRFGGGVGEHAGLSRAGVVRVRESRAGGVRQSDTVPDVRGVCR
jgi:predicted phage gp36 major capsid-like protein